jgi:hypothetical protein
MQNKYAIIDVLTQKVLVTSRSEKIIKGIFDTGFKTQWHTYKIIRV